ncbi:asparagine synthase (glutamine-hydrolyzing) [Solirubrobacter sp. CPCC 204708]|uniref:asparagine synthase (glutamine-hydrolyzing) n=1 Tax=Solirubrobacter deserti TaxID=2282478 RepID=A0ABT4RGY0_9ACTN|nr:asparagine synthase (glutamine-hydrolyzing) [Solirubrobacter deserti]MBE2315357.1 asparagine synthase (glutamine-hydrolyzing) [Solirubrobacter deserti]MDA0137798.1 asparagine synthase (glutamine-hydrolyzing) [Solirubrobacter deserti]
MCGIAGLLALPDGAPPSRHELAAMSAALAHRGPDGSGFHLDATAALAIRRLALVDPVGGQQPIANEDGTVRVVANGELYDHRAVRRSLERRGHTFRTGSDVEVLVHLYEERGPAFVEQLRGMFAVALWDSRRRTLVLARDPYGIKPLVYALLPGRLAFASELKALLALPGFPRDIDPEAVEAYLAHNAVPAPGTIFRAARKLEPGHRLIVTPAGIRLERYARPRPAAEHRTEPLATLAAEARERLAASVRAHLQADAPVGVLLSGGIDSGLVTAVAGAPVKTFSVGFDIAAFDELTHARAVAERYGTDHHELRLAADDAAELEGVAATYDEPSGDATALPYWLLARFAAREVKAVLTGEGADELFGGYQTYVADRLGAPAARAAQALAPAVARFPSSSGRLSLDFQLRRLALGAGLGPLERHHAFKQTFSAALRRELLGWSGHPLAPLRARYAETHGLDPIARLQDVDAGTFLADDLLPQADRAGMAHGLEVRVPFLDPVVAELAYALPVDARVRGLETKRVLRAAAAQLLPEAVVRGPKRGFCTPVAAWLRGPLEPLARDLLAPDRVARQGWLNPSTVTRLLERHLARREDLGRSLWALIAFGLWHDAWAAAPPVHLHPVEPLILQEAA